MIISSLKKLFRIIKIFIINFLILYFLLLLVEIYFQTKNGTLFNESKFIKRDILNKIDKDNVVHLAYAPYKLINDNNRTIVPLSGISNSRTIFCKDNDRYYEYQSDNYGFNNSNNNTKKNILIIGDSYVHGLCVDPSFNFTNKLNAINLGFFGNGPLLQYATYKEYAHLYEFKTLIWVITPDNDFFDLNNERQNKILLSYLNNDEFTQGLESKNLLKDKIIEKYFDYEGRIFKEKMKYYHLDLKFIRKSISNFLDTQISKDVIKSPKFDYYEKNINMFNDIINRTSNDLKKLNINFFVVFNAMHPSYGYPQTPYFENHYKETLKSTNLIIKNLKMNKIKYYNFHEYVYSNYSKNNIDSIFKKIGTDYDHYTIEGNAILAKEIIKNFNIMEDIN